MIAKRLSILLCVMMTLILIGCSTSPSPTFEQTVGNVADSLQNSDQAFKASDDAAKKSAALSVNQGMYVDTTPISLAKDPAWMHNEIILRGDELPFSYYSRTVVSSGKNILTRYQVGLDPALKISLNYKGTVKGALDLLASKTGYVYTVNGNDVYWQAFITKTFDIAFMPGTADYTLGDSVGTVATSGSGGSGGAGGATATGGVSGLNSTSTLKGSLSIWKDLEDTIKTLLSDQGKVLVSQSTTTVTVHDKPTNVDLVAQYIKNLNNNISRQVLVKIQVYEITLNKAYDYGINWSIVKHGFAGSNFVLNGNYGTPISITPLAGASSPYGTAFASTVKDYLGKNALPSMGLLNADPTHKTGVNLLISALEQQGKVSVVSEPRVVCLNNQVSVIQLINKQAYIASVQNTSNPSGSGSAGQNTVTSQVTPGSVTTGLALYVLPKIMGNKVYLQINADLSTNLGNTDLNPGSGTTTIQSPNINEKQFNQRSVINSGETLILSGFKQVNNSTGAMQVFGSQALGGKGANQANSETIVLITPIILDAGNA